MRPGRVGSSTAIAWTDHTFNPWWGCSRVSPGCENCYAETFAHRLGLEVWGKSSDRRFFGPAHWLEPLRWNDRAVDAGRRELVFCASMADVFEARLDLDDERERLWRLIAATPALSWQLLTKRPENVLRMVPSSWLVGERDVPHHVHAWVAAGSPAEHWPSNVWIGTTVEDQIRARARIPRLLEIPAPVRFLSCEPLLGPLDLSRWLGLEWMDALRPPGEPLSFRGEGGWGLEMFAAMQGRWGTAAGIGWIIAGGESGNGYRALELDHARDLRDQARAAEIPFFFKQVGGRTAKAGGDELDGETFKAFPLEARQ